LSSCVSLWPFWIDEVVISKNSSIYYDVFDRFLRRQLSSLSSTNSSTRSLSISNRYLLASSRKPLKLLLIINTSNSSPSKLNIIKGAQYAFLIPHPNNSRQFSYHIRYGLTSKIAFMDIYSSLSLKSFRRLYMFFSPVALSRPF
jgi:hypothetical protein